MLGLLRDDRVACLSFCLSLQEFPFELRIRFIGNADSFFGCRCVGVGSSLTCLVTCAAELPEGCDTGFSGSDLAEWFSAGIALSDLSDAARTKVPFEVKFPR